MKMILAIKNNSLEEKIISKYNSKYEIYITPSINLIEKSLCNDCILIIRDEVIGLNNIEQFIKLIKEKYNNIRIIIIVKKLTQSLKEFLFSKEVFSIIEGTRISFSCIVEMVDNPKMIVYKEKKVDEMSNVIVVTGGFSTGKSILSILISMYIAKKNRVVLIDMNYMHPVIDLYVNNSKNYAIEELVQDIEQKSVSCLTKYLTDDEKNSNLKYILNKGSTCQPNDNIITKIIEITKNHFDYVVIDTSSFMINKVYNMSQKNNYSIIHIIEPNIRGIKNYMEDIKYVDKELIYSSIIVLNKYTSIFKIKEFEKRYKFKNSIRLKLSYKLLFSNKINMLFFYSSIREITSKLKIINCYNRRNKNE